MECPVCDTQCADNVTKCEVCGFSDTQGISREIATLEEAQFRLDRIVRPYREEWMAQKRHDELLSKCDELSSRLDKLDQLESTVQLLLTKFDDLEKEGKGLAEQTKYGRSKRTRRNYNRRFRRY